MASFQAKIGWKTQRKRKNKNYSSLPFRSYTTRNRKFQKNSTKFKKLNNTIMASFQAKINWKRPRKRKKCKLSFRSVPTRREIQNSKKIAKKIQKTKQYLYRFISCQNRLEKAEKEKKYKLSFHSFPTRRVIENSKKIAKKFKKLKNTIVAPFQAKISWKRPRKRKNVNFRSVPFLPYA